MNVFQIGNQLQFMGKASQIPEEDQECFKLKKKTRTNFNFSFWIFIRGGPAWNQQMQRDLLNCLTSI